MNHQMKKAGDIRLKRMRVCFAAHGQPLDRCNEAEGPSRSGAGLISLRRGQDSSGDWPRH